MISGAVPWSSYKCTSQVALLRIVQKYRVPPQPQSLTNQMRCLLAACLAWSPESRPTARELLLYDSCSESGCPECMHCCPQAHMTLNGDINGDRVSSADTDVGSEYRYHRTSSRDSTGSDEELLSSVHSSSNSSVLAQVEYPEAVVCRQNPYAGRVRQAVSAPK
jgi:serine/threonine protein kinase